MSYELIALPFAEQALWLFLCLQLGIKFCRVKVSVLQSFPTKVLYQEIQIFAPLQDFLTLLLGE
jgi:hypothetical protein